MRLLVDTNLFIEVLLNQASSREARAFLENPKGHEIFVTDFALHSIGLLLFRQKKSEVFRQFLEDMVGGMGAGMVTLAAQEMIFLADVAARFKLDFDDAYQYTAAPRHGLRIVSFDSDFDRTSEGRLLPTDVL